MSSAVLNQSESLEPPEAPPQVASGSTSGVVPQVGAPTSVVVSAISLGAQSQQSGSPASSTGAIVDSNASGTSSPSGSISSAASFSGSVPIYDLVQNLAHHVLSSVEVVVASTGEETLSAASSSSNPSALALMKRTFDAKPGESSPTVTKKAKGSSKDELIKQRLEQRLNGILCCAVCLDLPKSSIFQCPNGHLMCAGCITHLLADARLRDESPTCPNCRISISKEACSRNLAVEKAVCELPGECQFCARELPRSQLEKHQADLCEERIVPCRFSNIGCPWNGPFHESDYHATQCPHPNKTAREVLDHLATQERSAREERKIYESLFTLLSYEKITLNEIQLRPYRTDEYIHKLFYESSRFTAFNIQWVVKARVNDDQRDPTQSCERHLSFQIALKSKITNTLTIHYMLLKGPYGDTKVSPKIYKHDFSESSTETAYTRINLANTAECNRLLAARMINFRLIMFQAQAPTGPVK